MLSLLDTIKCETTSFHDERLRMIEEEDYSGVRRKVAEELLGQGIVADPAWIEEGILALKQYYAIALLDAKNMQAVSERIDPFWHAHILHTRQYFAFCDRVYGHYMHHEPLNKQDEGEVARIRNLYVYTQSVYPLLFNYINEEFYPLDSESIDELLICFHGGTSNVLARKQAVLPAV